MPRWGSTGKIFGPAGGVGRKVYNNATGGTITTFVSTGQDGTTSGKTYRVHTFTSNGTFQILTSADTFSVLGIGGGNSGTGVLFSMGWWTGYGGAGASGSRFSSQLAVNSYSITVGAGGTPPQVDPSFFAGTASTGFGYTWGTGGNWSQTINFAGTGDQTYGYGGTTNGGNGNGGTYGCGGNGGGGDGDWGHSGTNGVVRIRYEIAP